MIVDCPTCGASYNVADDKVRGRRVRIRCRGCATGIIVDGRDLDPADVTRKLSPQDLRRQRDLSFGEDEATRVMSPPVNALEPTTPVVDEWLVSTEGSSQRSMTLDAIVEAFNTGLIDEGVLLWRDGMSEWKRLDEIEELKTVVESESTTRVLTASSLRVATRAAAPSSPAPSTEASEPQSSPGLIGSQDEGNLDRISSSHPVQPRLAPPRPAEPPRTTAKLVESRPASSDLFQNIERVGSERELLSSNSDAPGPQHEEKPSRNESSVLFSLNALKAGATSSAPPAPIRAAPRTAADLLPPSTQAKPSSPGSAPAMPTTPGLAPVSSPSKPAPPFSSPDSTLSPLPSTSTTQEFLSDLDTTPPAAPNGGVRGLVWVAAIALLLGAALGMGWFLYGRYAVKGARLEATPAPTAKHVSPPLSPVVDPIGTEKTPEAEAAQPAETAEDTGAETAENTSAEKPDKASKRAKRPPTRRASRKEPGASTQGASETPAPRETSEATEPTEEEEPETSASRKMSNALEKAIKQSNGVPVVDLAEDDDSRATDESAASTDEQAAESTDPAGGGTPFDASAAKSALLNAAASAAMCRKADGPTGSGKVQVTFSPNGKATSAVVVEGPFASTPVGSCVVQMFRTTKVPAFDGDPVTVAKTFSIPE